VDGPGLASISGTQINSPTSGVGWGNDNILVRVRNTTINETYHANSTTANGDTIMTTTVNADGTITVAFNWDGGAVPGVSVTLTDGNSAALAPPEPPVTQANIDAAQAQGLQDYVDHLQAKDEATLTADEQLFLDLMKAWAIAQDP
jgi:hypothetical protein